MLTWLLLLLLPQEAGAQTPGKTFGGTANEQAFGLCVLADGNYALAGRTRSMGAGANDIWVIKITPGGRLIWSQTFGSAFLEQGHWVEPTQDGGMVVLGFSSGLPGRAGRHDSYLIKLDLDGNIEWEGLYGAQGREIGFRVQENEVGSFLHLGYSKSFGNRGDLYFVKTDSVGNELWSHTYASPYVDYGHDFWPTADGGYILFGSESGFYYPTSLDHAKPHADLFLIKVDSAGQEVWRKVLGGPRHELGRAMHPAPNGGWYLFGATQSSGAGSFDQYLVYLDENFDSLWSKTYGGSSWDYGNSMDVDADGNLYLLGTTNSFGAAGSPDIWLHKADPSGELIWSLTIGGADSDYGYRLQALPEGGCILAGDTRSHGQGGQDIFFTRVTSNGRIDLFLEDISTENVVLYPVPVTGTSVVDPEPIIGQVPFEWSVYDMRGKLVMRENVAAGQRKRLQRSQLRPGAYTYEIKVGGERKISGKFLVQ